MPDTAGTLKSKKVRKKNPTCLARTGDLKMTSIQLQSRALPAELRSALHIRAKRCLEADDTTTYGTIQPSELFATFWKIPKRDTVLKIQVIIVEMTPV